MEQTAKRIGICVFSGTGNTFKCAKALEAALIERGVSVGFHEIADGSETAAERDLVICYPVYGFNMPRILRDFCRNLKDGGNVWFLKTSGEPLHLNDNSSAQMIRILRKKGYAIKGEFHYIMPYNMVFRHSDALASRMWETAKMRIPDAASTIAAGEETPISAPLSAKLVSALCRIEHWFYPQNGRLFRVDLQKCVRCQKCVKNCPTKNITYSDGRFRFGKGCIGCVRCSFNCPTGAIHIGLIDFMRVNGPYDFTRDPASATLGRYCRASYERYFADARDAQTEGNVRHSMRLQPAPFRTIAAGTKTIELRLYDEKRRAIRVGDTIRFTDTADETESLTVQVTALHVFPSFEVLYAALPLLQCGYTPEDVASASPADMNAYYSEAQQAQYGVVGIGIRLL